MPSACAQPGQCCFQFQSTSTHKQMTWIFHKSRLQISPVILITTQTPEVQKICKCLKTSHGPEVVPNFGFEFRKGIRKKGGFLEAAVRPTSPRVTVASCELFPLLIRLPQEPTGKALSHPRDATHLEPEWLPQVAQRLSPPA